MGKPDFFPKMDIQQKLNEVRKDQIDCQKIIDHYGSMQENLALEEVE